jgi:uncharacterized protein (DUF1499 family)
VLPSCSGHWRHEADDLFDFGRDVQVVDQSLWVRSKRNDRRPLFAKSMQTLAIEATPHLGLLIHLLDMRYAKASNPTRAPTSSAGLVGPALALSSAALCMLALAPFGWRVGWWSYGFGLYRLMPASGFVAAMGVTLGGWTLVRSRSQLRPRSYAMLFAAIVLGAVLVYLPLQYSYSRSILPPIHDITTDTDNPPIFRSLLKARAAERASSVDDRDAHLAQLQKAAYPDVAPLITSLPLASAFNEALKVAQLMPGWIIVASDPEAGRIEATEQSRWFRFTDDIVIRIAGNGAGARIDIRSTSRQGTSDYGVNAARIRAFMGALRRRIG